MQCEDFALPLRTVHTTAPTSNCCRGDAWCMLPERRVVSITDGLLKQKETQTDFKDTKMTTNGPQIQRSTDAQNDAKRPETDERITTKTKNDRQRWQTTQ